SDLVEKDYNPLSLRYLIMTTHYKTGLNFSWESLAGAQTAYFKLREIVSNLKKETEESPAEPDKEIFEKYKNEFSESLADDLNIAKAIGLVWQIIKSKDVDERTKLELILDFDKVLGLKLSEVNSPAGESANIEIPEEILELKKERDEARRQKNWQKSDELREEIEREGYIVEDKKGGSIIKKV
ncbi:cysteine--tRNA ligase, partial [Patescibacteria group bacterium]|nr:cysteine--tRNA ligase [Patescibacteria group bacterium]